MSKPVPPADLRAPCEGRGSGSRPEIVQRLGKHWETHALALPPELSIYSDDNIVEMATALGIPVARVQAHRVTLEHAAKQFKRRRSALNEQDARAVRKQLKAVEQACHNVLSLLYVNTPEAAEDGVGSDAKSADDMRNAERLAEALQTAIEDGELRQVVWGIGQLAVAAAKAIEVQKAPEQQEIETADRSRLEGVPTDVEPHLRLAVRGMLRRKGGDIHLKAMVADLLRVYESITGLSAALTQSSDGRAPRLSGKCLDFVLAALRPVDVVFTADQLDSMIDHAKRNRNNRM